MTSTTSLVCKISYNKKSRNKNNFYNDCIKVKIKKNYNNDALKSKV